MARGEGKCIDFIRALLADAPPTCVIWPFCRDGHNGYGVMGYCGQSHWAHRLVCQMARGEAPSDRHEATHSCGNGKNGCVNPRHLTWGTRTATQASIASRFGITDATVRDICSGKSWKSVQ